MLNSLETYRATGHACGLARRQRDESRAKFERDHFLRMRDTESSDADRHAADRAYDEGYAEGRGPIPQYEVRP